MPLLAARVTYVGELGWELYAPTEYALGLWDAIWETGAEHGLTACGYRAIDALRLEKGYRAWASDLTPETTPDEAGLGWAVKLDKPGGFSGRDAIAERRAAGPPASRLSCLLLDDPGAVALAPSPCAVPAASPSAASPAAATAMRSDAASPWPPAAGGNGRRHAARGRHLRRLGGRGGRRRAAYDPEGARLRA